MDGGSAIYPLTIFPFHDDVAMVTVPVAMVTGLVAMEINGVLHQVTKLRSRDPRDRPWRLALVGAVHIYFHTTVKV